MNDRTGDPATGRGDDPVCAAIAAIAERFSFALPAGYDRSLARDSDGFLPLHQVDAALDLAGLRFDKRSDRKLPREERAYPALIATTCGGGLAVLQASGDQLLVKRTGAGEAVWEDRAAIADDFGGTLWTIWPDAGALRDQEGDARRRVRDHWFWSEMRKERRAYRPVLLASFIVNLLAVSLPIFTMNVYDRVIPNEAVSTLWVLALGVILAFAFEYALRLARANVIDQIGHRLDLRLSQKIFAKLMATPLSQHRGQTGAQAAKVGEYAIVREFFGSTTMVLMVDLAFLVVFVAVIAYLAGWLALVPLTAIIAMAIAGFVLQRKAVAATRDAQADHGLQQTMLVESIAGLETVKAMGAEGGMLGRWRGLAEMGSQSQMKLRSIATAATTLTTTFQQMSTISLIIGGYYLFASGEITMGAIIAIVMLASRALAPAGQLAFLLTRGRQAREVLAGLDELFGLPDERGHGSRALPPSVRAGRVALRDVSFTYPSAGSPALHHIDLAIEPGERVAIIGRVASGKSTLGRLICGLYPPSEGQVEVDGIDHAQFPPQVVRSSFRFVGQDAALFTGSLKDNLALGQTRMSDADMIAAMRNSGADSCLSLDTGGFDRAVGESGRSLSGGQRSFLTLARALVSPCELLFLDEPTGAMDSHTEATFIERVRTALGPRQTLLIATHRPAIFSLCDRLIVMENGRIVADGPKDQIIAASAASQPLSATA